MRWLHAHLAVASVLAAAAIAVGLTHGGSKTIVQGAQVQSLVAAQTTPAADTHYPPFWRQRLLALLGAGRSTENLRLLDAWGRAEGGTAKWNPLNATYTLPYGESWSYNSSLVQNYWRPTGGVAAVALTLVQSDYACILGGMQAGNLTALQIVDKCPSAFHTWGTNPDTIRAVLAGT